jgi:acyl carrier protein
MVIRDTIIGTIHKILAESGAKTPVSLTDELPLLDSGLDSLGIAILVTRLEEALGFDPFSESTGISYPVTLGDLVRVYESSAAAHGVDQRSAS